MNPNHRRTGLSRRQFLKTAAATGAVLATGAPYIKTSHSAGSLKLGLWDHWIPGANAVSRSVIEAWGKKNGVATTIDYITSAGQKINLTITAEARAGTGHDIIMMPTWYPSIVQDKLVNLNDLIKRINHDFGDYVPTAPYLGRFNGEWKAMPVSIGSQSYPMVSRLDYFKHIAGVDIRKIFPNNPHRNASLVEHWNYENFAGYAEKLFKAGHPFGNPIGQTSDSQDWLCPLFYSFGSEATDKDGNITINSDGTREALEYMKRLTKAMPPDVYAWDDAGNNRWIISGKGSAIQNPPSAWSVAKKDRPKVAAQLWHHDTPRGPKGRYRGSLPYMWGLWTFAQNKSAALELMYHMNTKEAEWKLISAAQGYDLPQLPRYYDHPVWKEIGPPVGTQYNYPVRGDETLIVGGYPAPPNIASQVYTQGLFPNLVAQVTQGGKSVNDAIKWAENELEGYLRG